EAPIWLLLLIPALLITFVPHLATRRKMGARRRRAALAIRTILLSALVLALAGFQLVLPVDRLATVFVVDLSDSVGESGREDALAAARGIQVETRVVGLVDQQEVLVDRLTTPSTARLGEEIEAVAEITSSVAQPATVRLFADGALVETLRVDLKEGANRVVFRVKPTEPGFHTFRAVVEAANDTFSQNDRADSNTIVKGEPRILVLAGNEAVTAELDKALKAE